MAEKGTLTRRVMYCDHCEHKPTCYAAERFKNVRADDENALCTGYARCEE